MIDNKKEQERDELQRTIWNMANDLRGSVDGWDFKQYVFDKVKTHDKWQNHTRRNAFVRQFRS